MDISVNETRILQFYKEDEAYVSQRKKKQQTYWYKGIKWGFEAVRDMLGMSAFTFNKYAKKYGEHAPEYAERDIRENKVKRRAAKKFKDVPKKLINQKNNNIKIEKYKDVNQIYSMSGFIGPQGGTRDNFIMDVISGILSMGKSCRLCKKLILPGIASAAHVFFETQKYQFRP